VYHAEQCQYRTNFVATLGSRSVWGITLAAYDFRENIFRAFDVPPGVGYAEDAVFHSLDRVGDKGVLIALGGMWKALMEGADYVSNGSCLLDLSGFQTKSPNSFPANIALHGTHLAAYG